MPLFHIEKSKLTAAKLVNFEKEKEIQSLVENNLEVIFNCKFIDTEFSTGTEHAGRIDTLALSEDNNPVIIEYKKVASSELVNQSLYYLSWIKDHKGDFQIAVNKKFGDIEVDWSDIRVICIAPEYKKYDLYAVKMTGISIELWQYKRYNTNTLYLEEIFKKSKGLLSSETDIKNKNPIMVEAGKKAAQTRQNGSYTFEEHLGNGDEKIKKILMDLQDFILNIDEVVEEVPKKYYIAYKVSQNFACIEVKQRKLLLFLKIDYGDDRLKIFPDEKKLISENIRDVTNIGHLGTGNLEITINNYEDFEKAKKYIKMSFENIGG